MSDSEGSDDSAAIPSDTVLTKALRNAVKQVFKSDLLENLTVKRIRKATEEELELAEDFFKHNPEWSAKSKQIIQEEAEAQHALRDEIGDSTPSPVAKKPVARQKQAPKEKAKAEPLKPKAKTLPTTRGTKRSSPDQEPKGRKRQKKDEPVESELSELSESSPKVVVHKKAQKPARSSSTRSQRLATSPESGSDEEPDNTDEDARDDGRKSEDPPLVEKQEKDHENVVVAGSESEMSVLIDEEPPPKRKRQKSSSGPVSKKAAKAKPEGSSKSKEDTNLDPQQAEIKRLQSWLLKCGIRKFWNKELAPYDTPKAKINYLKGMLKDVGLDGRYSAEKAKQIKENRELKADLEAVQEGAKKWGQSGGSEDSDGGEKKPKRRLARGLKELDFLSDSGGEETD